LIKISSANKPEAKMSTSSSEQLKKQIGSIPDELQIALEQQAKARIAVAQLEALVNKLEPEIERDDGYEEDDDPEYDGLDNNLELLRLESKVERLKLQVTEAEDRAEMDFRKSTAKTTEALVKAAIGTNSKVMELRNKLLDAKEAAKERKITLESERMKFREAKLEASYRTSREGPPETEKLFRLQEKLLAAANELIIANNEVEVVRAKIETFKMLVQLEKSA
jgi:hypothetical protein